MILSGTGTIPVDGAELRYEVARSGEPIVVLHGGPGIGYHYLLNDLGPLLGDSHALLFYDQRGSGHSSGAADSSTITMATFVQDLDRVRVAAGLQTMPLLGHSFGGLLGMYYAITYPERVSALVLVDSDPASRDLWIRFHDVVAARRSEKDDRELEQIQSTEGWKVDPVLAERVFKVSIRPAFADPALADTLDFGFDDVVLRNYATTHQLMRQHLSDYDIHHLLHHISAPTLVLYGTAGLFPVEAPQALHQRIPDSHLVELDGVGHFPHVEAPERFASAVGAFLRAQ